MMQTNEKIFPRMTHVNLAADMKFFLNNTNTDSPEELIGSILTLHRGYEPEKLGRIVFCMSAAINEVHDRFDILNPVRNQLADRGVNRDAVLKNLNAMSTNEKVDALTCLMNLSSEMDTVCNARDPLTSIAVNPKVPVPYTDDQLNMAIVDQAGKIAESMSKKKNVVCPIAERDKQIVAVSAIMMENMLANTKIPDEEILHMAQVCAMLAYAQVESGQVNVESPCNQQLIELILSLILEAVIVLALVFVPIPAIVARSAMLLLVANTFYILVQLVKDTFSINGIAHTDVGLHTAKITSDIATRIRNFFFPDKKQQVVVRMHKPAAAVKNPVPAVQ